MITPTFSEVIKIKDGIFYNLPLHIARAKRTARHFFNREIVLGLSRDMIPDDMKSGLVKCRVVYSDRILSIEFVPYSFKVIQSVAVIPDDHIEYAYKSTDRSHLNNLLEQSGCDEVIIAKNGYVTDTSFANLVFENESGLYTPTTYLFPGTKREKLLQNKAISKQVIKTIDIKLFAKIYLINSMIDIEDRITIPVENIHYW